MNVAEYMQYDGLGLAELVAKKNKSPHKSYLSSHYHVVMQRTPN